MGVAYVKCTFGLSQRCPTRPRGLANRLIREASGGHVCSLIVRCRADSCTGEPREVRHGAA